MTPPRRPAWIALLAGGFLLQFAWRLYLSWPIAGPVAHGDEDGYMLGARVLAGGPDATLPSWSIMRPIGYPLVLTPAYWFAEEPSHVYVGVHIINAVLMALTFPLIYLIARRLFDMGRVWSAAVAFVLATLPSMVFFSQFALTDALLPAVVMTLLLTVHAMFSATGRAVLWYAIAAGAIAAYAANTHVRGLVMLGVVAAVVALGTWRRWLPWRPALAYFVTAFVVFVAGWLANAWLEDELFETSAFSANGRVLDRLTSFDNGIFRVVCDGAGQIWHLCTSTYGLAALGLAAAIWALYRREESRPTRIVLGAALAIMVGIALATAAGTPNEGRINNHVYGRYVAMFAAFWALVGIVALARSGWRRAAWLVAGGSALTVASIAAVVVYVGRRLSTESYVNFDSPELSFLSGDWEALHIYPMTAYAIGFMVVFAAVLSRPAPRWLPTAALVAVMALNLVAMVVITDRIGRTWSDEQYNATLPQLVRDAGVRPGDTVVEASSIGWWINLRHQHEVYWQALPRFDPTGPPPPSARYVVAAIGEPADWDGTKYGYSLVLRHDEDGKGRWAVWRKD